MESPASQSELSTLKRGVSHKGGERRLYVNKKFDTVLSTGNQFIKGPRSWNGYRVTVKLRRSILSYRK